MISVSVKHFISPLPLGVQPNGIRDAHPFRGPLSAPTIAMSRLFSGMFGTTSVCMVQPFDAPLGGMPSKRACNIESVFEKLV